MLTAAHCDVNGPNSTSWYHGRYGGSLTLIGTTCSYPPCQAYHIGGYYDAEKVGGANQTGSPYNRVYYNDSNKSYAITSVKPRTAQANGDYVNLTGLNSGTHAAVAIANNNANWCVMYLGSVVCLDGARVHTLMVGGDSGGPDYYAGKAMGLTSAIDGSAGDSYYVFADENANALNVSICTNDACT